MPCAVQRLRGYISPLAYPYMGKEAEVNYFMF